MAEKSRLPAPKEAFLSVVNHLALEVLVGNVEVAAFDQAINALIAVVEDGLQTELAQLKLVVKRLLADQTKATLTKQLTRG